MPKPIRKKKKFIDPKNERTATFAVIHRSQKDPLAADDEAPQRVLQVIRESVPDTGDVPKRDKSKKIDDEKQKKEERDFGVFYDDDYNYMQHLKDRQAPEYDWSEMDRFLVEAPEKSKAGNSSTIDSGQSKSTKKDKSKMSNMAADNLPDCVFGTEGQEEAVGLLNKAAPTGLSDLLEWDPDIVETLDDDFRHEVVLTLNDEDKEDANDGNLEEFLVGSGHDSDSEYEDVEDDIDSYFGSGGRSSDDEENDRLGDLDGFMFANEETRSRFTAYSMSSSVLSRNKHLRLVDDKFEEFMAEYDDENLGGLECDEIEGSKTESSETMKQVIEQFQKTKEEERQRPPEPEEVSSNYMIDSFNMQHDKPDLDTLEIDDPDKKKEKWDCESILTTYSTLYNRPKLIKEDRIRVCSKTGIPKDILGKSGLTESALKKLNRQNADADIPVRRMVGSESDEDYESEDCDDAQTISSRISAISFRNKHETPEEKKARKLAVKELKKERRVEKKANTTAFKLEKRKQEKLEMCNLKNAQVVGGKKIV